MQNLEDKNFGEIQIFKSVEGAYIMKLDRNHVKGDLNQQIFKNIIQYTILKECKYLIPIVHIVTHECNSLVTQKTDSASSMNAPPSSHNTITTPLQTCSKTKKYSKNQNCGLY